MTKYIKDKNGKFAGSIGDGKNLTPALDTLPSSAPSAEPENGAQVEEIFDRFNEARPTLAYLTEKAIYEDLEVEDVTDPHWEDYDEDGNEQYAPVYEVLLNPDLEAGDLSYAAVKRIPSTDEYVAEIHWSAPRPDYVPAYFGNTVDYGAEIGTHKTKEAALEHAKKELARMIPAEVEFNAAHTSPNRRTAIAQAAANGFQLEIASAMRRNSQTAQHTASFHSRSVDGAVQPRAGYITMQPGGGYLCVVRYAGSDLNKETNPTGPMSKTVASVDEAYTWVEKELGRIPAVSTDFPEPVYSRQ